MKNLRTLEEEFYNILTLAVAAACVYRAPAGRGRLVVQVRGGLVHGSERTGGKYRNHRSKWSLPPPSDMVFITCEPTPKLATLASAQMTNQLMPCAAGQEERLRPERRFCCGVSYVGGALPAIPYTAAHRPLRARPGGGL